MNARAFCGCFALAAVVLAASTGASVAQGGATAQAAPTASAAASPSSGRPQPVDSGTVVVRAEVLPADEPQVANPDRMIVDTRVSDVRVNDLLTLATMDSSPDSSCPSNDYVFERNRPGWIFQTGRLLQAMKEGAVVRISFRCLDGYQSINAIQFLSPPGAQVATAMPLRAQSNAIRQGRAPAGGALPPPLSRASAALSREERARQIPLP